jgi:2'-5' RNA ligase
VPGEVRDALTRACLPARQAGPALRWVDPDQWHVTLAFYGEVPDDRVPALVEHLSRRARRVAPLALHLSGSGSFGPPSRPRVLWLGVAGDDDEAAHALTRLAGSARAAGRKVGLEVPDRASTAHVTLARARHPADLGPVHEALAVLPPLCWTAPAVHLVRSDLGAAPGGSARHTVLASLPFRSPVPDAR